MADFVAEDLPDFVFLFPPEEGASPELLAQDVPFVPSAVDDETPPVIDNYVPALLTEIAKNQSVQFDVTDNTGQFTRIVVACNFAETGIEEVVHDGDEFRGAYKGKSSRSAIAGGFRYTVLRGAGGWIDDPDFRCFAIDRSGNEAP